jgi:hypothetical protein
MATTITADLRCECGYDLHGLSLAGRCPECGMAIIDLFRGVNRVDLHRSNIIRTTAGAYLILSAHLLWPVSLLQEPLMVSGLPWVRSWWVPAAGGPNLAMAVALAHGGWQHKGFQFVMLSLSLIAQLVGIWFLTSAAWGRITRSAVIATWVLRLTPLTFVAIAIGARQYHPGMGAPDGAGVISTHLVQAIMGVAWGVFLWELGRALRSNLLVSCGQLILVLLSIGSAGTAASMLSGTGAVNLLQSGAMLTAAGSVLLCITVVKLIGIIRAPQPFPNGDR